VSLCVTGLETCPCPCPCPSSCSCGGLDTTRAKADRRVSDEDTRGDTLRGASLFSHHMSTRRKTNKTNRTGTHSFSAQIGSRLVPLCLDRFGDRQTPGRHSPRTSRDPSIETNISLAFEKINTDLMSTFFDRGVGRLPHPNSSSLDSLSSRSIAGRSH
jgi:hypothetical protein